MANPPQGQLSDVFYRPFFLQRQGLLQELMVFFECDFTNRYNGF